jgi:rhamnulokinase
MPAVCRPLVIVFGVGGREFASFRSLLVSRSFSFFGAKMSSPEPSPREIQFSGPVHLAVDLGASSGRVIAGGVNDGKLELVETGRFVNRPLKVQDAMLWNHLQLWQDIQDGLRDAALRAQTDWTQATIASVGVDTWGVSFGFVDPRDQIAGPVWHYRDARHRGMVEKICEIMPRETIFQETGMQFMDINSLCQLIAAKQNGDSVFETAESFLMMGDLFHWLLSGERSIEASNASTTQLLNPATQSWSTKLLDGFGLPREWFAEPTPAGTTIGTVQPSVAMEIGLHDVPVILPATHDTASAVLAVPAEGFAPASPDWCYISSGTWSLMGVEIPQPNVSPLCAELNFTNEGGVRGSTRLLQNIGGLWIYQQIRAALDRQGNAPSWAEMTQAAAGAEPFALLVNPDDPALVAPDNMIDAICGLAGRTGQRVPTDNGVLFRGALEGLALRYRMCLQHLESLTQSRINTIHIVGGGSLNALLCQMTADACGRRVVAGPVEATAIGNILMQMIGSGSLHSIDEARELVRQSFPTQTYEPQTTDRWDEPAAKFATFFE